MADPGVGIDMAIGQINMAIGQILHHVGIAFRCKRELESLRDLVTTIERTVTQIHHSTAGSDINASEIISWLIKLSAFFQGTLTVLQKCSIPRFDISVSRYKRSIKIITLISYIKKRLVPFFQLEQQMQMRMRMEMRRESAQPSSSTSATTSEGLSPSTGGFSIQEADIEGADIEMGLNQQPEGNNNTDIEMGIPLAAQELEGAASDRISLLTRDNANGRDIEMGLQQPPEGNNNTQQESGIVATPHYVQSIATCFATCHGAILALVALVMMTAPVSSEVRNFILFVSALVSVAIICDLVLKSYNEFSRMRGGRSLRRSLVANQRLVIERIAIFLIFIMFSLGLLLVSNRVLKHH